MTLLITSNVLDKIFYTEQTPLQIDASEVEILTAATIQQSDELIRSQMINVLVFDVNLLNEISAQTLAHYKEIHSQIKLVCLANSLNFIQTQQLFEMGCSQILRYPISFTQFIANIQQLFNNKQDEKIRTDKQPFQFSMLGNRWRFVLEHQFWINLFMTKTSKNIQAVNEHIKMLGLQIDTEACYRPILVNILGQKPFSRWDDTNGLDQMIQLFQAISNQKINATYYDDNRAMFLLSDISPHMIRSFLLNWLESCKKEMNLDMNCCIGRPRSFLMLCEEMPLLLKTSDLQPKSQQISWTDGTDAKEDEALIQAIKQYIFEHMDHTLSRKELANHVFLSESYISHVWRNSTGSSLKDYVTTVKMEQAKKMLRETNLSISEIALMLGYTHFSYFSSTFKKKNLLTPAEYRKQFF